MKIDSKYIDLISKKLDLMNRLDSMPSESSRKVEGYKIPDIISQMGETAKRYLESKSFKKD